MFIQHDTINLQDNIETKADEIYDMMQEKIDAWQDTYDERSGNEPEYESQIEKWQDALDRLEEKISEAEDVLGELESWKDYIEYPDEPHEPFEVDIEELAGVITSAEIFNDQYKGFTPAIKKLKELKSYIAIFCMES